MRKWILIIVMSGVAVTLVAAMLLRTPEASFEVPGSIQKILEAQENLPPAEVAALQELRLIAAVQLAYFNQNGTYATPPELQSSGVLDPEWPRTSPDAYTLSCEIFEDRPGFACYADPVAPFTTYYFVNPSQAVRLEKGRRPDEASPVFGSNLGDL